MPKGVANDPHLHTLVLLILPIHHLHLLILILILHCLLYCCCCLLFNTAVSFSWEENDYDAVLCSSCCSLHQFSAIFTYQYFPALELAVCQRDATIPSLRYGVIVGKIILTPSRSMSDVRCLFNFTFFLLFSQRFIFYCHVSLMYGNYLKVRW